jgi:hypothetical protein
MRVFENRVLRRIFGPKREEVAGGWRRLHNEELHNFVRFTKYCYFQCYIQLYDRLWSFRKSVAEKFKKIYLNIHMHNIALHICF